MNSYTLGFISIPSNYGPNPVMELVVKCFPIPALAERYSRRQNQLSSKHNMKEQFGLKTAKKMPEVLLTRKSSSQYTLPLTL